MLASLPWGRNSPAITVRWFFVTVLSLGALSCFGAATPYRVLIIHSFGRDYAPFRGLTVVFRTELARQLPRPVEFLETSLEMARSEGEPREGPLRQYLLGLFEDGPPDLVVPVGAPAALFYRRHRESLFPRTPVLITGSEQRRLRDLLDPGQTSSAVCTTVDVRVMLENILQVLPRTRRVYVVFGITPLERFWEAELRREWAAAGRGIEYHWLSDQPLEKMRDILRNVPADSAVFYGILNRDAAGVPLEEESGLRSLREVSSAPVFGYSEEQLGSGIVGGRLMSFEQTGRAAAKAAARLLGDASALLSPIREAIPMTPPRFDWRELARWGIPKSAIPAGSTVFFQEPSLWESHRDAVLVAVGVTALQTCLIVLLVAARRRAREIDARLRLAADSANVGLWERDVTHDEIAASPLWRRLFGLPADGPIRLADVFERIHPEERARLREVVDQANRERDTYELEHRVILPDGSVRWIYSLGRSEFSRRNRWVRSRGVSMDITERKRTEADAVRHRNELARLSRVASLGVLSGSIAHELNQPLGIILTNAQAAQRLLRRGPPDLAELQAILDDIIGEDRRAGEVIRRLRALLQRGEIAHQFVDLEECIEEVLRLMRSDLMARHILVKPVFARNLPCIQGDRIQLQQIFLNLLVNACDAIDTSPTAGREITVATTSTPDDVQVAVHDRGPGLPSEPESLFEPFHTTKPHGLGMGLAICRMLVAAHGGRIWAESNPDGGATFHVTLPVRALTR